MESKAVVKFIRVTPRKARLVVDVIRGKRAGDALNILKFMPQHASKVVEKLLRSAIANAEQKNISDVDRLKITKAFVDQGPTMKRMMPRAMGRANIIKKRSSHITLVLGDE
ncbi:MAG: 50S ribosomal protein L22 [Nitrospirae bacterium]|nr:50S ribosomal protein L22 [Nitrospirota bacterium]MBI5694917.1 50S ribosomal protein L22 [Nitrospirota bacterium]